MGTRLSSSSACCMRAALQACRKACSSLRLCGTADLRVQPCRELYDAFHVVQLLDFVERKHLARAQHALLLFGVLGLSHAQCFVLDDMLHVASLPDAWQDLGGDPSLEDLGFLLEGAQHKTVDAGLVNVHLVRLLIRGARLRDNPFHKLSIGLLILLVYVLAECLWSVGICKAGGHLASLKPRYLVHCHGGDLKWVLIRAEDLECHSRAAVWPDKAGVELLLDVLLCVSPSFDIGEEYYAACLNALH